MSLMAAMAAVVPCIASRIRGNVDLMENDDLLFEAVNVGEVQQRIEQFSLHASELEKNNESIVNYSAEKVTDKMREVYNVMSSR